MINKSKILEEFKKYTADIDDSDVLKMFKEVTALVERYAPQKNQVNRPMTEKELENAIVIINGYAKKFKGVGECWPLFEAHEYFKTQLEFLQTQGGKEKRKMWT